MKYLLSFTNSSTLQAESENSSVTRTCSALPAMIKWRHFAHCADIPDRPQLKVNAQLAVN